ncbi:hypothetical protein J2X97_000359 [Epilithonimonas hungarica]|uniref:hypothetical protein n=1 Tax=Epilithonimonas hungarica TaxID=454006 RepID=UPI0027886590|nr:hypothetical protein [Epilithonimonas hungarica]MDP9954722.1 hypothetical protein [Epilithonimonas hungarica]
MKEVLTHEFIQRIASDFGVNSEYKDKRYIDDFPIVNGKRKINSSSHSIIVDNEGNEFPYMKMINQRNDEKLQDFNYIYLIRTKSISEIVTETGVELKTQKCKICEGGGWHTNGTRYIYKDIYCEI